MTCESELYTRPGPRPTPLVGCSGVVADTVILIVTDPRTYMVEQVARAWRPRGETVASAIERLSKQYSSEHGAPRIVCPQVAIERLQWQLRNAVLSVFAERRGSDRVVVQYSASAPVYATGCESTPE